MVFIFNFFIDYLLLYSTKKILKETTTTKRLLLGSLVASSSIFLLFLQLNSLKLLLYKIVISIIIILVTFGRKNFVKTISHFYLVSIILGGALYLLDISFSYNNKGIIFVDNGLHLNLIVSIMAIPIIIFNYIKEQISYKNEITNILEIRLTIATKKYTLKAMVDTGNKLSDPYKKRPVILINNTLKITPTKYIYVPYKALNTSGVIKCFHPTKIEIGNKEFKNYLIGISTEKFELNGIDCILPNKIKEELW